MTKPNMRKEWKDQMNGKPGPLPKKLWYKQRIIDIYHEGFFSEWRNADEIAFEVNKYYPAHWTAFSKNAVHSYMKRVPQLKLRHRKHGKNAASLVSEWREAGKEGGNPATRQEQK